MLRSRRKPHLEPVDLSLGQLLHEPGKTPRYACFPTSAIVSLVSLLSNGVPTEMFEG